MESKPINDTAYNRFMTLLLFRLNSNKWMRRLRKSPWGIVCVSSKRCIKAGESMALAEANATFKRGDRVYILMERVPGRTLSEDWIGRSEESRLRILEQLRGMVDELRSLSPPNHITGVANVDNIKTIMHQETLQSLRTVKGSIMEKYAQSLNIL
ncbi:hypothetical protein B0T21DRAFT_410738 [Apiosordaria backusii]|uniref:Uncharacterized protein n=1 Tax=Apiosordaria backusii TaxID=314023 RepID=A0AA40BN63_9PEZI|nr:hypothetical protein B0T21DRAFT_410738 [Apiosordaria backusii]